MKKNLKTKIFSTIAGYVCLQILTFCMMPTAAAQDPVVEAINRVRDALRSTTDNVNLLTQVKTIDDNLNKLINETFVGKFSGDGKKIEKLSHLDETIGFYATNFYQIFASANLPDLSFPELKKDPKNPTSFYYLDRENSQAIKKLLSQEFGYNTQKDYWKKSLDSYELLSQPIETGGNNIDRQYFIGLSEKPGEGTSTPYGSLDDNAPIAKDAPNIRDLIGPDGYDADQLKQAKLFINYVKQSSPPPKTFYIPSESEAKNNKVTIYLPYPSADKPYKESDPISTEVKSNLLDENGKPTSEYRNMVATLNANAKYYQKYKMKVRAANIIRTIYLENLYRAYQNRVKDSKKEKSQSLAEKDKAAAFVGLSDKYYEDLKTKSTADINIETLLAINKVVYFLFKLHEDNERLALLATTGGLQIGLQDIQDENDYIKPIGALIENKCWLKNNAGKGVCIDPLTASTQAMPQ